MTRAPSPLAMLAVLAMSPAAAQTGAAGEGQVLTFTVTAPPSAPPVLAAPSRGAGYAPPRGSWVVGETRSPVDYGPVATATSVAAADDAPRLSIQCRGGRTEVLVLLPAAATGRETVTVGIDDEPLRPLRAVASSTQDGVVLRDAPLRFLAGLPPLGTLRLRVAAGGPGESESRIALATLATVLRRLEGPCASSPKTP